MTAEELAFEYLAYIGTGYLYATKGSCYPGEDLEWARTTIAASKRVGQYDDIVTAIGELMTEGVFIGGRPTMVRVELGDAFKRLCDVLVALALPEDLGGAANSQISRLVADYLMGKPVVRLTVKYKDRGERA